MYGILLASIQQSIIDRYGEALWLAVLDRALQQTTEATVLQLPTEQPLSPITHASSDWSSAATECVFHVHGRYPDDLITRLAGACAELVVRVVPIGRKATDWPPLALIDEDNRNEARVDAWPKGTANDFLRTFGQSFVGYTARLGFADVMGSLGRHYRDFLAGIDNLHETMRFTYRQMNSPSFYVTAEDEHGCVLHYRSRRIGYTYYVIGQLEQIARELYNVDVDIRVVDEQIEARRCCHVIFELKFDNRAAISRSWSRESDSSDGSSCSSLPPSCNGVDIALGQQLLINGSTFFKVFPFSFVFDQSLTIVFAGPTLQKLLGRWRLSSTCGSRCAYSVSSSALTSTRQKSEKRSNELIGRRLAEIFKLRRPQMELTWKNIINLQNVVFELETNGVVTCHLRKAAFVDDVTSRKSSLTTAPDASTLMLKGQMKYINSLEVVVFMCNPILCSVSEMQCLGLHIDDLNMYDSSRQLVMAGWQQASKLETNYERERDKGRAIGETIRKLDEYRKRSETLIYAMIPEPIAERLKNGEDTNSTWQSLDCVTIMFGHLIGFNELCADCSPEALASCVNSVFTVFDDIVDTHGVFKVETLGDDGYMIAGGVPKYRKDHAISVARAALEFVAKVCDISVPDGKPRLQIQIGMDTGSVVAGVVGKKTPQYCLFGDTVNTASRMQSTGKVGSIHLSEFCCRCLRDSNLVTWPRGMISIKGKGPMSTHWLVGSADEEHISSKLSNVKQEVLNERKLRLMQHAS